MKAWLSGRIVPPLSTWTLAGGEWSASRPGRFTPGTHLIGGWVGLRTGPDAVEKRKFRTEVLLIFGIISFISVSVSF
jgi:hypothetical protein